MALEISWDTIVGGKTITNGGLIGDLLTVARAHVDDAVQTNRLTQAQAGEIYTAMVPAAFQQAIQYELSGKLADAQLAEVKDATIRANIELDDKLLTSEKQRILLDTDEALKEAQLDQVLEQTADILTKSKITLLNTQLSAWSTIYNSGKLDNTPNFISDSSVDILYNKLK